MADLSSHMPHLAESPLIILSIGCLIIGFGIKMALFPLHGWQPAAHSYAHPAADPMIAGIMIKVPAYAMLRFFFCIFEDTSPVMDIFYGRNRLYGSMRSPVRLSEGAEIRHL